jgi:hypothetical protein
MNIIKEFKINEVVFDNLLNSEPIISLTINDDDVDLNFNEIINSQFKGGNVGIKFEQIKDILNLGLYSKAPCGGFLNFYELRSKKGRSLIVYSGNEVSNSHYLVTVHKIINISR